MPRTLQFDVESDDWLPCNIVETVFQNVEAILEEVLEKLKPEPEPEPSSAVNMLEIT